MTTQRYRLLEPLEKNPTNFSCLWNPLWGIRAHCFNGIFCIVQSPMVVGSWSPILSSIWLSIFLIVWPLAMTMQDRSFQCWCSFCFEKIELPTQSCQWSGNQYRATLKKPDTWRCSKDPFSWLSARQKHSPPKTKWRQRRHPYPTVQTWRKDIDDLVAQVSVEPVKGQGGSGRSLKGRVFIWITGTPDHHSWIFVRSNHAHSNRNRVDLKLWQQIQQKMSGRCLGILSLMTSRSHCTEYPTWLGSSKGCARVIVPFFKQPVLSQRQVGTRQPDNA